jgi:hypothetical protein
MPLFRRPWLAGAPPGRHRSQGQSVVEFALVLPLLLLILLIVVDVGRLYLGWVTLQNAARVGANYAANHPTATWSSATDPSRIAYEAAVRADMDSAALANCPLPTPLPIPTFLAGSSTSLGQGQVNLSCPFSVLTPRFLGISTLNLGATAVFPIRSGTLPVPTPTATPVPTPTPAPTPTPTAMCEVPTFIGTSVDDAAALWLAAHFTWSNLNISLATLASGPNYTIASELVGNLGGSLIAGTPPSYFDGQSQNCATFVLTVGP